MPATLKDIADEAGVSIKTASRILGGHSGVHKPETRERVLRVAQELSYLFNSSARALRQGRFGCLALVLSTDPVFSMTPTELLRGILDGCAEQRLHITLARLSDQELASARYVPKMLQEWMADGLLISYNTGYPQQLLDLIDRHNIPAIWINTRQEADCVFPNDKHAALKATEHLIALGHCRIAYVDWTPGGHYSVQDRREGYCEAMAAHGLAHRVITTEPDVTSKQRIQESVSWLRGNERPTAIVTYTPHVARPVMYAAYALDLEIPRDLSVITFADEVPIDLGRPIDIMRLPEPMMGKTAVELLVSKIAEPSLRHPALALDTTFTGGWTTAPPNAS